MALFGEVVGNFHADIPLNQDFVVFGGAAGTAVLFKGGGEVLEGRFGALEVADNSGGLAVALFEADDEVLAFGKSSYGSLFAHIRRKLLQLCIQKILPVGIAHRRIYNRCDKSREDFAQRQYMGLQLLFFIIFVQTDVR